MTCWGHASRSAAVMWSRSAGNSSSAASDERAATALYAEMQRRSLRAYREVLDGDDVDVRVDLMAAQLVGVAFNRYIVRTGPLASMTAEEVATRLARVLRSIMFE